MENAELKLGGADQKAENKLKIEEVLIAAQNLAQKIGHVFLTTSNDKGIPHLTIATKMSLLADNRLSVSGWFCPGTLANLESNANIGVTIWDAGKDFGYQLLGLKTQLKELAMLDGYIPETNDTSLVPQVEWEILIQVEKVLEFKQAPHTDHEIQV